MTLDLILGSILMLALVALAHFIAYWPVLLGLKLLGISLNTRYLFTAQLNILVSVVALMLVSSEGLSLRDNLHDDLYTFLGYLGYSFFIGLPVLLRMWWGDRKSEAKKRPSK